MRTTRQWRCSLLSFVFLLTQLAAVAAEKATEDPAIKALRELSIEELMKVKVTSVTRTESTVGHSPTAIFVITREMIRRSGATSIPELFRMVPGMNVARMEGNKWSVGVRGLNDRFQRFLLAQVDGRSVYSATFAGVYWDALDYPLEDIERIEVIRGPGASVWGANAVNGIINIITKSAKDTQGGLVSAGGGSEEHGFGTFRYGAKVGEDLFYRFYGKGFSRAEQFSTGGDSHDGWWGTSGGLRLDWKTSDQDTVTFDAGYLRSEADRRDSRPQIASPYLFSNRESELSHAAHALARWTRRLDDENSWSLQAYWDRFYRLFLGLDEFQRWDTYDVDFQHQLPLGERHNMVWGLGYRMVDSFLGNSGIDNGFILSYVPNHSRQHLFSAFVQDQITLVEGKLILTLGSKIEHNSFTGFEYQPTGRLLWTPTPRQSVWAAVSRAVRTPSVADDELRSTLLQTTAGVGAYPQTQGNPNMKSEELLAWEIGYRVQASDRVFVDTTVFYNDYDRMRAQVTGTTFTNSLGALISPRLRGNFMDGEIYGAEFAPRWQATDHWQLSAVYSALKINLHTQESSVVAQARQNEGQSPQQQISLQSSWNLPRNMEFDLMGRWVDELPGFTPATAAYFALDARLAWHPRKNLTIEIVGQNLLDNHHPESGTSAAVRSPLVEIERAVYGKITWTF